MWDTWLWLSLCYSWFFTCCCTSACFCHPIHYSHLICCHCSIFGGNPTYCQYLLHPPNFTQNYLPIFQNPNKTAPISWEVLLLLSLTNTLENDVGIFWRKVSLPTRWRDLRGIHPPKPQAGRRGCRREERKGCGLGGPYLYQLDLPLMVEAYGTSEQGLHFEGHQVNGVKDYKLG